jgi:RND family efflux transporter MFP subunit
VRDTLAYIDDKVALSNYRQAKSQVLSAENNLKIAQLNLKSDQQLFENGDISELAYENSQLTVKTAEANHLSALAQLSLMEKNFMDTRVISPINGFVSRKDVQLGTMVNPGQRLFRVVDLNLLKINIGIAQSMIDRMRIGSKAIIKISALGDRSFEGIVKHISPQADENTGAFTAEIHVRNTDDMKLKAGMTTRVDVLLTDETRQISIPDYVLVAKNGSEHVYKVEGNYAVLSDVDIAETIGSTVVLNGGLAEGDTVVSVGMKNLGVRTRIWIEHIH